QAACVNAPADQTPHESSHSAAHIEDAAAAQNGKNLVGQRICVDEGLRIPVTGLTPVIVVDRCVLDPAHKPSSDPAGCLPPRGRILTQILSHCVRVEDGLTRYTDGSAIDSV